MLTKAVDIAEHEKFISSVSSEGKKYIPSEVLNVFYSTAQDVDYKIDPNIIQNIK